MNPQTVLAAWEECQDNIISDATPDDLRELFKRIFFEGAWGLLLVMGEEGTDLGTLEAEIDGYLTRYDGRKH